MSEPMMVKVVFFLLATLAFVAASAITKETLSRTIPTFFDFLSAGAGWLIAGMVTALMFSQPYPESVEQHLVLDVLACMTWCMAIALVFKNN